mmetsp:Transcript_50594/g.76973  ORF Transcript_50594/g.76973 Transcript_50594/m.76973 type:complete len:129 (+) Transcript_50594:2-388(+)
MAWLEFQGTRQKLVRYNRCLSMLKDVLTTWNGLIDVEQAAKENIFALVDTAENIITGEVLSWTSSAVVDGNAQADAQEQASLSEQAPAETRPGAPAPATIPFVDERPSVRRSSTRRGRIPSTGRRSSL